MSDMIDRLVVAMNAHDLDAAAGFFHEDDRSTQPTHPGRAFAGIHRLSGRALELIRPICRQCYIVPGPH